MVRRRRATEEVEQPLPGARLDAGLLDTLVAQARAGRRDAFGRLWQELSPLVAGYVRGRGAAEVEDVTSEVFLAAFQRLPFFTGDGAAFRRWLFTIAHHRAVDDVRRQVRGAVGVPYEAESDPRHDSSAEAAALERFAARETLGLLDALPGDQREVLLLRIVADLPAADVAAVLGRSPDAVRQLQHRALGTLRRRLGVGTGAGSGAVTSPVPPSIAEV